MVSDVRPEYGDGVQASSAWFEGGHLEAGVRLRFRLHGDGPLDHSGTPFVPLASVLGAWAGVDVVVDAPVDAAAVSGARAAVGVQCGFWGWRVPVIEAPGAVEAGPAAQPAGAVGDGRVGDGRGVGLFFTRGVDSTSALLTSGGAVTHLLGIDWVDAPLATEGTVAVWAGTAAAVAERGLPLLRLSTDLRTIAEPAPGWDLTHAVALAGFALLLAPQLREVRIASATGEDEGVGLAAHPRSDPLWSSSAVAIVHDFATEGGRLGRTAVVASDEAALASLKVCFAIAGDGNCGRCTKCLATMTALEILGAYDPATAPFRAPLTSDAVRALAAAPSPHSIGYQSQLVDALGEGSLRDAWVEVVGAAKAARAAAGLPI